MEGLQRSKCITLGALKDDRSKIKASWSRRELSLSHALARSAHRLSHVESRTEPPKRGACAKQSSLLKLHPFERPENVIIHLCVFMCDELALIHIQRRKSYFGALFDDFFHVSSNNALCVSKGDIVKVSEVQAGFQEDSVG